MKLLLEVKEKLKKIDPFVQTEGNEVIPYSVYYQRLTNGKLKQGDGIIKEVHVINTFGWASAQKVGNDGKPYGKTYNYSVSNNLSELLNRRGARLIGWRCKMKTTGSTWPRGSTTAMP